MINLLTCKTCMRLAELQRRILARMRALGMTPVLPAFAGFVPEALAARFPDASISRSANWCKLPEVPHCLLVNYMAEPIEHAGAQWAGAHASKALPCMPAHQSLAAQHICMHACLRG